MNLLQSILNTLAGPDLIAAFQRCLFWSTIVAVGALLLAVTVILFKRTSGVADSLESQAREALGMSRLPYGIRRVPDALRHSYFPSPGAIVLLVAMLVLVVVLNTTAPLRGLVVLPWNVDKWAPSTVDALLGLASAVFALVLFIAESLRSQDGSDRGRVLLKESWLFPIVVMVIGFTIVPLLSTPSSWIFAFSVVVVGGLLIRAFYMVISILTDFPYFERKRRLFLTQRLKSVMTELIVGRLISNRFLKLIEESDHLQYRLSDRLLSKGPTDHEFKVSCPRSGVFNNALPRAVLKLDRKLRALFAARVFPTDDSLLPPPDATKEKDKYCFLVVRPGGPIDRDQTIAVVRPPKKISQGQQRELEQLVRDILRIGDPAPVDLYIQDFANLQKHAAIAIREGAANALEDDRKHYLALVTTFFDSLPKDVRYDAATARKEIYSLEGGWKPIASLRDHIKQLLDIAVAEGSDEAMYQLAFMPMHLVGAAIQRQDQYIIQSFLPLHTYLASLSYRDGLPQRRRTALRDRTWRYLVEHVNYVLSPMLEVGDVTQRRYVADVTREMLRASQSVLKLALDNNDVAYLKELKQGFSQYRFDKELQDAESEYQTFAFHQHVEPSDKTAQRLERARKTRDVLKELSRAFAEIKIGVAARAIQMWRQPDAVEEERSQQLAVEAIAWLPTDVNELTNAYLEAQQFRTQDYWGWDNWEMEKHADGEVHAIDVGSTIAAAYAAGLISASIKGALEPIKELRDHDLARAIRDENSATNRVMTEIREHIDKWRTIMPGLETPALDATLALLRAAAESYEGYERDTIASGTVLETKVDEFIESAIKARDKAGVLRTFFDSLGKVDRTARPFEMNTPALGINQLYPKEAFFGDWHVQYIDLGRSFGEGLAQGEDSHIFEQLAEQCPSKGSLASMQELIVRIEQFAREQHRQPSDFVVLGANRLNADLILWQHEDVFVPSWKLGGRKDNPGLIGAFKVGGVLVDVYETAYQKSMTVLAISRKQSGELVLPELKPSPPIEEARVSDGLVCRVVDLNTDNTRRERIIAENPPWLQNEEDKGGYLRRKVVIELREVVEVEAVDVVGAKWEIKIPDATQ